MRIIAGSARGRTLQGPSSNATRPTSDKLRESLFDILASRFRLPKGARVLDLCCGTGALALEALSRGAKSAILVDASAEAAKLARQNAQALGFTSARVFCADAFAFLEKSQGSRFSLVFADPPYGTLDLAALLARLVPALAEDAVVVLEHSSREEAPAAPPGLDHLETRRYSAASLSFFSTARPEMETKSPLSARARTLQPSRTLVVAARAKALLRDGVDIIDFSLGEPDFPTPVHIREAAKAALDAGFTKYTEAPGMPRVREAIAARARHELGLPYSARDCVLGVGAKQCLFHTALSLLDPGDEAIIPSPYWVSYPEHVTLAGATPVFVATAPEDGFVLRPEALEAAITPRTKVLYLNSPSNPTGATLDLRQLRALAEVLRQHPSVYVISDEIYQAIHFGAGRAPSLLHVAPDLRERVVVIDGASKAYSMTGWRLGWAIAPVEVAQALGAFQSQSSSGVAAFEQHALVAALEGDQAPVAEMCAAFEERAALGVQLLAQIPGVAINRPTGAFYLFPDVRAYLDAPALAPYGGGSVGLANYLLERARVATIPGIAFGAEGFLRFSCALPKEKLAEGLHRFQEGLTALR